MTKYKIELPPDLSTILKNVSQLKNIKPEEYIIDMIIDGLCRDGYMSPAAGICYKFKEDV